MRGPSRLSAAQAPHRCARRRRTAPTARPTRARRRQRRRHPRRRRPPGGGERPPTTPAAEEAARRPRPRSASRVLALVSWVFGIMMAVAQDLPALENRAQYESAAELGRLRPQRRQARHADRQRGADPPRVGRDLADDEAGRGRDRGPALLRAPRRRLPRHRPRARTRTSSPARAAQGASTITQQFVKNALAAQDSRTVLQKLREAALAYQLERQWSKDKILTEYLNSIYFGEGAYGIEAAARPTSARTTPAAASEEPPLRLRAAALRGGAARGDDLLPDAYRPRTNPDDAQARRNLVLENMGEQGYSSERGATPSTSQQPLPTPSADPAADEDSKAPYFTSWLRQQIVDRYGAGEAFGGGLRSSRRSTSSSRRRPRRSPSSASPASSRPRPWSCSTTTPPACSRWSAARLREGALQPRDQRPAPAGLLVQAVHARHRARRRATRPSEVFASAPQEIPFEAQVATRAARRSSTTSSRSTTTRTTTSARPRSRPRPTYSDNSVYAQLGLRSAPTTSPRPPTRWDRDRPLDRDEYSIDGARLEPYNPALILGGLERRHAARDGLRLQHPRRRRRRASAGRWPAPARARSAITEVTDDEDGDDLTTSRSTDKDGDQATNEVDHRAGDLAEARRPRDRCSRPSSPPAPARTPQTGDSAWGKTGTTDEQRRRLVLRRHRGDHRLRLGRPRRQRRRRWRPSSAGAPGRRRHVPGR